MQKMLGALAAAAVLVAGCTSGGGASESSSPTVTPGSTSAPQSASSSPVPTRTGPLTTGPGVRPGEKPPVLDPEGLKHTPSGALAFAAYFIQAVDWSIATNDAALVKNVSDPSCQACRNYILGLDQIATRHESQAGGRISIESAKLVTGKFRTRSDYVVEFKLSDSQAVLTGPTGISTSAGLNSYASLVFVSWRSGRWLIVEQGSP